MSETRSPLWYLLVLGLLISAGLAVWFGRPVSTDEYADAVFLPEPTTLARGVHLLGRLTPGAGYVVETSDGLILIDAGLAADAGSVVEQLQDLGLASQKLRWILLTHGHGDHSLGAKRLREVSGAKIAAGAGDIESLEQGEPREAFFSTFYMPDTQTHATAIDVVLEDGHEITLGDTTLQCLATPGHTPGSFCFLLERDGQRMLFTGDTVTSLTSDLGIYASKLPPKYGGDAASYLASLRKLRELEAPDLVFPGHPRMERVGTSPRIAPEEWSTLLGRGIDELQQVVGRLEGDGADFLDGTPKQILPQLYYFGDYRNRAIYAWLDNEFCVFDAPGAGYLYFLRERAEQLGLTVPEQLTVVLTSAGDSATRGLPELASEIELEVVIPPGEEAESWKGRLTESTTLTNAEQFAARSVTPMVLVPLAGVGQSPVAYEFQMKSKKVLVTGEVPVRLSRPVVKRLVAELQQSPGAVQQYAEALDQLSQLAPDIWLTAAPTNGQNANQYDDDWQQTIDTNRSLLPGGNLLP